MRMKNYENWIQFLYLNGIIYWYKVEKYLEDYIFHSTVDYADVLNVIFNWFLL